MSCIDELFEMQPTEVIGNDMLVSAYDFVYAFSKIHIASKVQFARAWKRYCEGSTSFHESIGQFSMRGNSRDDPTAMEHNCKKTQGCTSSLSELTRLPAMNPQEQLGQNFACSRDGSGLMQQR
ncbi:hypothetical protein V1523DRAFT_395608 [Lipomyces doorenjongii]